MELWTRERIVQIAPDPASAKAGEGLATPRKWVSMGHDESAAWGECQGSGAKPYQVQVDLKEAAFKCSCPSRKFPCKHGIGLMLMHAAGQVGAGAQPPWVQQWLASRGQRQAKKQEAAAEVSPQVQAERADAQENRRSKRLEKVTAAMDDLRLWLEDLVRAGLATAPTKGFAYFDERSRRLVDGQAPGAARLVREIASAASSGAGWQERTLEAAARAYLLATAAARLDKLPDDLRQDVLATLGVTAAKEAIDAQPTVSDIWQVLGREIEVEANLKTQKTYLFGLKSRRPALLLDFAYGNAGLDAAVPTGTLYPADLAYYPGRSLRAVVRATSHDVAPLTRLDGLDSIAALLDLYATLLGERPWLEPVAFPLTGITPILTGESWWAVDATGNALPLKSPGKAAWALLAISAGRPVSLAATTDGRSLRALSVVADGAFTDLAPSTPGGVA